MGDERRLRRARGAAGGRFAVRTTHRPGLLVGRRRSAPTARKRRGAETTE